MLYDALDSVLLAVADLEAARQPYERLGLRLSPAQAGQRSLSVGQAYNRFAVHFMNEPGALPVQGEAWRQARPTSRGLFAVALGVADLDTALDTLAARGVQPATREGREDGVWLSLQDQAGADLILVPHADALPKTFPGHSFPLKRLDHLGDHLKKGVQGG